MTCQRDLMNAGKPYPRTCEDCKLGPCKKYPGADTPPVMAIPDFLRDPINLYQEKLESLRYTTDENAKKIIAELVQEARTRREKDFFDEAHKHSDALFETALVKKDQNKIPWACKGCGHIGYHGEGFTTLRDEMNGDPDVKCNHCGSLENGEPGDMLRELVSDLDTMRADKETAEERVKVMEDTWEKSMDEVNKGAERAVMLAEERRRKAEMRVKELEALEKMAEQGIGKLLDDYGRSFHAAKMASPARVTFEEKKREADAARSALAMAYAHLREEMAPLKSDFGKVQELLQAQVDGRAEDMRAARKREQDLTREVIELNQRIKALTAQEPPDDELIAKYAQAYGRALVHAERPINSSNHVTEQQRLNEEANAFRDRLRARMNKLREELKEAKENNETAKDIIMELQEDMKTAVDEDAYLRSRIGNPTEETIERVGQHDGGLEGLIRDLKEAKARINEHVCSGSDVSRENDKLRGLLANSDLPCTYCGLEAADMGKCKSGFPGCARGDDMQLDPKFGEPVVKIDRTHILRRYVEQVAGIEGVDTAMKEVLWDDQRLGENPFTKEEEQYLKEKIFPEAWIEVEGGTIEDYKKWMGQT